MTPHSHPPYEADLAPEQAHDRFLAEVLAGLQQQPKTLPPKYFYDAVGSALFDRITELPEYYPTRTEAAIMRAYAHDMAALCGPRVLLIEFGSGSSVKTRLLLDQLADLAAYVPIDISAEHLYKTAAQLRTDYPDLAILPIAADYSEPLTLPLAPGPVTRRVVYFPGSTIGNMPPALASAFLSRIHDLIAPDGALLIGVDLKKAPALLIPAYNDEAGITAAFNCNLLRRINRELHADFRLEHFEHRAIWNEEASRIEMHLISLAAQRVLIEGTPIDFIAGESICTEYSYKYTVDSFAALAAAASLRVDHVWIDDAQLFSVQYLTP